MIIPLSSTRTVSANAYTNLQETVEKAAVDGQECGTGAFDRPVSITPVHAAADTPHYTIPSAARSLNVPPTSLPITSYGSQVSDATETSWEALRAGASYASPCLLRRADPTSITSSLDEPDATVSSSLSETETSILASLFPSVTASPTSLFPSFPTTFPASLSTDTDSEAPFPDSSIASSISSSSESPDTDSPFPNSSIASSISSSSNAGEESNGATTTTPVVTPGASSEMSSADLTSLSVFPTSLLPSGTLPFPTSTIFSPFPTFSSLLSFSPASPLPTDLPSSETTSSSLLSFSPSLPLPTDLPSSETSESDAGELSTSSTDDSATTMDTTSFTSTIDSTTTTSDPTLTETTSSTTSSESTSVTDSESLTTTIPPSSSSFSDPPTNSTFFSATSSETSSTAETSDFTSSEPIVTETRSNSTFSEREPTSTIYLATRSTNYIGATVITSLTITTHGKMSSDLETLTSTYITSRSGAPMTMTTVLIGPSGTLNNGDSEQRNLSSGAIAGISLVSSLAVVSVLLWVLFALRRRHRRRMHQNVHYAVRGGGSPHGGMGSFRSGAVLGAAYGSNSSGFPIRTSPLQGEDEEHGMHQSSSSHSGVGGGPGSVEGEMVQSYLPGQGHATMLNPPGRSLVDDSHSAERLRGGGAEFASRIPNSEDPDTKGRNQRLLDAAGLGSTSSGPPQLSISPFTRFQDPFSDNGRTSIVLGSFPPPQRARSVSPPEPSSTRSSLLPTRTEPLGGAIGSQRDTRRNTELKRDSSTAFQRRSLPPSSWPIIENSNTKGKGRDDQPSSPSPLIEPNTSTFGRSRSRSSVDLSSSGHGHMQGKVVFTSSQGHGSATASGELEGTASSGSGSSGSHHGSTWSQKRRKRRSNSDDGGFFARAASLARTNLITQPRRASAAGLDLTREDARRLVRPPSPVSRLVPSVPSASEPPIIAPVIPPSPPPTRVPSVFLRAQSPGKISLPPRAPSALTRASGASMGLPAILATPSPLLTPDHAPDGRLDPRLAARLREIHNVQSSMSTIGLRDHEDYSRPILPLVNNRDSLTSASSEYSQPSRSGADDEERTPTRTTMAI